MKFQGQLKRLYEQNIVIFFLLVENTDIRTYNILSFSIMAMPTSGKQKTVTVPVQSYLVSMSTLHSGSTTQYDAQM